MSQPSSADIDHFRLHFFQQMIQKEETKEKQQALRQRMCHHRYEPTGRIHMTGHAEFLCARCDHVRLSQLFSSLRTH